MRHVTQEVVEQTVFLCDICKQPEVLSKLYSEDGYECTPSTEAATPYKHHVHVKCVINEWINYGTKLG